MKNGMLRVEEVAALLHCSANTVNAWYRFKKAYPEDEYAKMLPEYEQQGGRTSPRYWRQEDLWKLIEFRTAIPTGRNGVMGDITQKYINPKGRRSK